MKNLSISKSSDASPQKEEKSPEKSPNKTPTKRRMVSAFDHLAVTSKKALDAFKSVLGSRSRQDLLASYWSALEIQSTVEGEGKDKAINDEIADLRKQRAEARASRA